MDKLIESMSNINVRKNDGYLFIKRDEIYVPIMKTILSITKRSFYSLQVKTEYYLSLVFDEKYIITGVAKDIVIMDSNTHIHKVEFYLQVM